MGGQQQRHNRRLILPLTSSVAFYDNIRLPSPPHIPAPFSPRGLEAIPSAAAQNNVDGLLPFNLDQHRSSSPIWANKIFVRPTQRLCSSLASPRLATMVRLLPSKQEWNQIAATFVLKETFLAFRCAGGRRGAGSASVEARRSRPSTSKKSLGRFSLHKRRRV